MGADAVPPCDRFLIRLSASRYRCAKQIARELTSANAAKLSYWAAVKGLNWKCGGMNAHQMIGTERAAAKMPAGAPPTRLATRMAGTKPTKYGVVPNNAMNSCMVAANITAMKADAKAGSDQGRSKTGYSERRRIKSPQKFDAERAKPIQGIAEMKARVAPRRSEIFSGRAPVSPAYRSAGRASSRSPLKRLTNL